MSERIIKFYKDEKLLVSSPLKGGSSHTDRHALANLLGLGEDWTHCVLDGIGASVLYGHYRLTHKDTSPYFTTFDEDGVEIKEEPPPPEEKKREYIVSYYKAGVGLLGGKIVKIFPSKEYRETLAEYLGVEDHWQHVTIRAVGSDRAIGCYNDEYGYPHSYWHTFDSNGFLCDGVLLHFPNYTLTEKEFDHFEANAKWHEENNPPPSEPKSTTREEVLDDVIRMLEEGYLNYCSPMDGIFIRKDAEGFANAVRLVQVFRSKDIDKEPYEGKETEEEEEISEDEARRIKETMLSVDWSPPKIAWEGIIVRELREHVLNDVLKEFEDLYSNYYKRHMESDSSPEVARIRSFRAEGFHHAIDILKSWVPKEGSKPKPTPEEFHAMMAPVYASCYNPPLTPVIHKPWYGDKTEEGSGGGCQCPKPREEVLDEVIKGMNEVYMDYYKAYAVALYSPANRKERSDIAQGFLQGIEFVMDLRGVSDEETEEEEVCQCPKPMKDPNYSICMKCSKQRGDLST